MTTLPAKTGWIWVKQGFSLFRKQPAEISTLFLSYMFLMFVIGILPVLGQVLPLLLIPVFTMGFMQACRLIEQGQRVSLNTLLVGFRSPAFRSLLLLGCFYVLAVLLSLAASALIDGGVFWSVMSGQARLDADTMNARGLSLAMLVAALVYLPAMMAFWYAAPLIMWQDMKPGRALFYSFFAVRNAGRVFIVYGLSWMLIGIFLPAIGSNLIARLLGNPQITMLILLPVSLLVTAVMYCSFYPTYTWVFARHNDAPAITE
jgi:uncharacterized membrane protein YuzA (DUF378 family)